MNYLPKDIMNKIMSERRNIMKLDSDRKKMINTLNDEFKLLVDYKSLFEDSFAENDFDYWIAYSHNQKFEEIFDDIIEYENNPRSNTVGWEEFNDGEESVDFKIVDKLKWFWWYGME